MPGKVQCILFQVQCILFFSTVLHEQNFFPKHEFETIPRLQLNSTYCALYCWLINNTFPHLYHTCLIKNGGASVAPFGIVPVVGFAFMCNL